MLPPPCPQPHPFPKKHRVSLLEEQPKVPKQAPKPRPEVAAAPALQRHLTHCPRRARHLDRRRPLQHGCCSLSAQTDPSSLPLSPAAVRSAHCPDPDPALLSPGSRPSGIRDAPQSRQAPGERGTEQTSLPLTWTPAPPSCQRSAVCDLEVRSDP